MQYSIQLALAHVVCTCIVFASTHLPDEHNELLSRSKRLVLSFKRYLWTGGVIPYVYDSSLPNSRRREYEEKVFPVYEKYSCIRFVKRTDTTREEYNLNHGGFLIFEDTNKCISKVGRSGSGGQRISCCYWRTCIHEVGHALGLQHEHTSPIRNKFIRIDKQNIVNGVLSAFALKTNVDTYDIYDSDSIMHYGLKAWSKNGKPTITFLDPNTRPLSKFANNGRYYYMFMEINDAYGCTVGCDLDCANGGYAANISNKCACQCPEGLDPKTQCTTLLNRGVECGGIIELNDNDSTFVTESPKIRGHDKPRTCYWFIKSPEKSRILLDFPRFYVREKNNGGCKDEVAVRPYLPGMIGRSYCGNVFTRTVQSDSNILAFSFTQAPTQDDISSFIAKAKFVYDDDFCYNKSTGGVNYNSKVKSDVDNNPCLYWDSVQHCHHHTFNTNDADKNLVKNYCRNPDGSKGPWCYTKSDGCVRNYCDACNLGMCKDLISKCKRNIYDDPTYCSNNRDASRNCRKTCGLCSDHQPLSSISTTFCKAPKQLFDAEPQSFKERYNVGEKVTVKCKNNADFREITCLSNGSWTPLKYVCGTCIPGWINYDNTCYKFFNDPKKRENAAAVCADQYPGSTLVTHTKENHDFLANQLITDNNGGCKPVWLDLGESEDAMVYTWSNGQVPTWTKWVDGRPTGLGCVVMNGQCKWTDKSCSAMIKFVCQYSRSAPVICEDQRYDCQFLLKRDPKFCTTQKHVFARSYCAKTCDLC